MLLIGLTFSITPVTLILRFLLVYLVTINFYLEAFFTLTQIQVVAWFELSAV